MGAQALGKEIRYLEIEDLLQLSNKGHRTTA